MKKKPETLPGAELDVMWALWELGAPSSAAQIHSVMTKFRPCTKPAVHILAERLAAKGFVLVEQVNDPVPYKRITPLVTEDEYASSEATGLVEKLFHGSWKRLVANVTDREDVTDEDIAEIEQILRGRKGAKK